MDAVNQLIEQVRAFFAAMTPGARLTAGLLLAVVVVSVAYLFQQSTAGADAYLFDARPLEGSEIVAIEGAFGKAGLADHEVVGNRIRVPRAQKADYLAAAYDAGAVPTDVMGIMEKAFTSGSMLDSRADKEARLMAARERQLSKMVTDLAWVSEAAVILSEEKLPGLNAKKRVAATAQVKPLLGETLDRQRVRNVQRLVAGWNPSLSPAQVTVIDQSDSATYGGFGGDVDPDEFDDPYHRTLVAYENRARKIILRHLSNIPGVRVEVNATLEPRIKASIRKQEAGREPLVRNTRETTMSNDQSTTDGAGRPGLEANGPGRNGENLANRLNRRSSSDKTEETASLHPDTTTVETIAGLVPREVQASVVVPLDHVVELWRKEKSRETGEAPEQVDPTELATYTEAYKRSLTTIVEGMLPDPPGAQDEFKRVTVDVLDTVPAQPMPKPSVASEALFFASKHASTAAMVVVGLVGLVMLRSVVNGGQPGDGGGVPTLQLQTGGGDAAGGAGPVDDEDDGGPKLQLKKPESLKDDLASIVRDDPDAAAAILRGWIGNAG